METWFLSHVLGLSLSVLMLGLPGPLGAGTPSSNGTDPVTAGSYSSTATDELSSMGSNATSTSYSSESLSPSQRNILLTHTAETHTAAAGSVGKITVPEACGGERNFLHSDSSVSTRYPAWDFTSPAQQGLCKCPLPISASLKWDTAAGFNRSPAAKNPFNDTTGDLSTRRVGYQSQINYYFI